MFFAPDLIRSKSNSLVSTFVKKTEKGDISNLTELYPLNLASIRVVVPLPQNGSRTVSPSTNLNLLNILETSSLPKLCLNEYHLKGGRFLSD